MHCKRFVGLAIVLVIIVVRTARLSGARAEFVASLNDQRLSGAQVCFYRVVSVTSPLPVPTEVVCLPADKIIQLPAGKWRYWLQHADGFASIGYQYQFESLNGLEQAYKRLRVPLLSGALIALDRDMSLSLGEAAAIWIYPNDSDIPYSIPIDKTAPVIAPADTRIVLVIASGESVTHVGDVLSLKRGASVLLKREIRNAEGVDVAVPALLDLSLLQSLGGHIADTPHIVARLSNGSLREPVSAKLGLRSAMLFLFKDLPRDEVRIQTSSDTWERAQVDVDLRKSEAKVVTTPMLYTAPATRVDVRWSAKASDVAEVSVERCKGSCDDPRDIVEQVHAIGSTKMGVVFPSIPLGQFVTRIILKSGVRCTVPFVSSGGHVELTFSGTDIAPPEPERSIHWTCRQPNS